MESHQLSQAAFDRLRAELDDLATRGRLEVAAKIERARELGDLTENGDYQAAKDEQGHLEGRIRQLEAILEKAEISPTAPLGAALIGHRAGDTVSFEAPTGELRVRVLGVEAA
jgi:transcription elongation factor GreA